MVVDKWPGLEEGDILPSSPEEDEVREDMVGLK